jgi:hypothetical protein
MAEGVLDLVWLFGETNRTMLKGASASKASGGTSFLCGSEVPIGMSSRSSAAFDTRDEVDIAPFRGFSTASRTRCLLSTSSSQARVEKEMSQEDAEP